MVRAVMVGGLAVEAAAWWWISSRRASVWAVMTPVLVGLGVAALLVGPPAWAPDVAVPAAAAVGAAVGLALYVATRAFVVVVRRWGAFQAQSVQMYGRRGELPVAASIALAVTLMVPGEELFWRGLFQVETASALGGRTGLAAALTWGAFVLANLPSANLAIVAGAVVGGAVWTGLGWWSGGALAPLASHAVWTTLMLAFPVVRRSEVVV